MTDEEYLFRQTEIERKRIGYGDRNKKRQGGRYVRLPSDNLSRKERNAMNSDCVTFDLKKPIDWKTLRSWPDDIQREYFKAMDEKYQPTAEMYSEMLGVSKRSVYNHRYWLQLPFGAKGSSKPDIKRWRNFINPGANDEVEVKNEQIETAKVPETKEQPKDAITNIALMLNALAGSGAKVTIEITL